MKILAVSEHYFPRVAGTVNYLHETLSALVENGLKVELWVPGPEPENWLPQGMAKPLYRIVWIDAGYPATGDPARKKRITFCRMVNEAAKHRAKQNDAPDVLHIVFGLFLMEFLDAAGLREIGLPSVATVHNVPPAECRLTTSLDPLLVRCKEKIRLLIVEAKNRQRLKANVFDRYIVPSAPVSDLLIPIVGENVEVIGHGPTSALQSRMRPPFTRLPVDRLQLLTVAGFAPHKRQHIIPSIAEKLRNRRLKFSWDVVGPPSRVPGYVAAIKAEISTKGLGDCVRIHQALPLNELAMLYDTANLYIQPSIEEGFCITALDAAAAGLPVIGSPAGAIREVTSLSGGVLVESVPDALATSIFKFSERGAWPSSEIIIERTKKKFSWQAAAISLAQIYSRVVGEAT